MKLIIVEGIAYNVSDKIAKQIKAIYPKYVACVSGADDSNEFIVEIFEATVEKIRLKFKPIEINGTYSI